MASTDKWRELGFKDKSAYFTALASFTLGWIMVFVGMLIEPMGEVDATVITCFGIALSYCGGIYGIVMYIKGTKSETFNAIMDGVNNAIADRMKEHSKEKENEGNEDE